MNPQDNRPEFTSKPTDDSQPRDMTRPEYAQIESEIEPATNSNQSDDPLGTTINAKPASQPTLSSETIPGPSPVNSDAPVATAPTATGGMGIAKRSKKPLILGVVTGALVLLLGGAAAAYHFWYQNPDKVVTDSLVKALTAKTVTYAGTIDSSADSGKFKVAFDGRANDTALVNRAKATLSMGAMSIEVSGDLLTNDKGDTYFKLQNVKDIAGPYIEMMSGASSAELDAFIAKIDNKWIKVTAEDLSMGSADEIAKQNQCFSAIGEKFKTDRTLRGEVTDLYKKQRFIAVEESLGEKDGNLGYKLDFDRTKAKEFAIGLKTTKLYGELQKCDKNFKIEEKIFDEKKDTTRVTADVEIWANKWSHELAQLKVSGQTKDGTSKGSFVLNTTFNKPVTIQDPTDAMPLSELQQELGSTLGLLSIAAHQGVAQRADASANQAAANQVAKYAEMFNALKGRYPTLSELLDTAKQELAADDSMTSRLVEGRPNSEDQIGYQRRNTCSAGMDGATVFYIDTTTGEVAEIKLGNC